MPKKPSAGLARATARIPRVMGAHPLDVKKGAQEVKKSYKNSMKSYKSAQRGQ